MFIVLINPRHKYFILPYSYYLFKLHLVFHQFKIVCQEDVSRKDSDFPPHSKIPTRCRMQNGGSRVPRGSEELQSRCLADHWPDSPIRPEKHQE